MPGAIKFPESLKTKVVDLLHKRTTTKQIQKIIKTEFGRDISDGSISMLRKENHIKATWGRDHLIKGNNENTKTLTFSTPKCLYNRLFPRKGKRSQQLRDQIEDFLTDNLEILFSYVCNSPDMKITSIHIKPEQYNLLKLLKEYRLFTSMSEILRFIVLHTFLNQEKEGEV